MSDDEFRRITGEFQQQVLELLTSCIDEAFDRALATLPREHPPGTTSSRRPTATAAAPKPVRAKKPRGKPAVAAPIQSSQDEPVVEHPRRTSRTKGASRSEVDRLVEQGLTRRLAEDAASASAPAS